MKEGLGKDTMQEFTWIMLSVSLRISVWPSQGLSVPLQPKVLVPLPHILQSAPEAASKSRSWLMYLLHSRTLYWLPGAPKLSKPYPVAVTGQWVCPSLAKPITGEAEPSESA